MAEWKDKIQMTFGGADLIYAGHPNDEARAFELLTLLREQNIGWADLETETRAFLNSNNAHNQHIEDQIDKMKNSMSFWLLD